MDTQGVSIVMNKAYVVAMSGGLISTALGKKGGWRMEAGLQRRRGEWGLGGGDDRAVTLDDGGKSWKDCLGVLRWWWCWGSWILLLQGLISRGEILPDHTSQEYEWVIGV